MLGEVPKPDVGGGIYLVDHLFSIGPTDGDKAINWQTMKSWSDLTGIQLQPWQYEIISQMSRAYLSEMHSASKYDAQPPWPDAVNMWRQVRNKLAERSLDRLEEKEKRNGSRKRR